MKCPKCGFENQNDAVFCEECGHKLDEKLTCPSCGAELREGAKFCVKCGAKVGSDNNEVATSTPATAGPKAPVNWLRSIQLLLLGFGLGLMMVGMFCSCLHLEVLVSGQTIGTQDMYPMGYFFKDFWKEVSSIRDSGFPMYATTYTILGIFTLISYIVMLVGVIISGIVGIVNVEKHYKEEKFVNKAPLATIGCTLPFILMVSLTYLSRSQVLRGTPKTTQILSLGYGTIILIVGLFAVIGSVVLNAYENKAAEEKVKVSKSSIYYGVAALVFAIAVLLGFSTILNSKNNDAAGEITIVTRLFADAMRSDIGENVSAGMGTVVFALFLSIISIIEASVAAPLLAFRQDKKSAIFAVSTLAVVLVADILALCAGSIKIDENNSTVFTPSPIFIVFAILTVAAVILMVLGMINEKKKAN